MWVGEFEEGMKKIKDFHGLILVHFGSSCLIVKIS